MTDETPTASGPSKWWWAGPVAGFIVITILLGLAGGSPERHEPLSSYDASPEGFRAAYLLLEELHYPVVRSKHPAGGAARLVLSPTYHDKDVVLLDRWVRDGGTAVLADSSGELAEQMGLHVNTSHLPLHREEEAASGMGVSRLAGGTTRVTWPDHPGRVEVRAGGEPFLTIYRHERGEVWLVNRPDFLKNRLIGKADNGVLLCRLAEALLREKAGELAFDEYFHGMRARPGVTELLLQPPTLWVTLEGLLLMGLLVWHAVPRFGKPRPEARPARRSKEEFLNAMAYLLERKGDYGEAFATARDDLVRDFAQELGLPAGAPAEQVVREAARRRGLPPEAFLSALRPTADLRALGRDGLIKALNRLETIRDEFDHARHT